MSKVYEIIGVAVSVTVVAVVLCLLLILPVYFLWNWLMPIIFGLPTITLWQAGGLILLSNCLIKSSSTSSSPKN